ncbi:MAG: histidine kinase dimerization/phospho-acceptor domain-containing protein, partial [Gemmatimonadaceae bacterium]
MHSILNPEGDVGRHFVDRDTAIDLTNCEREPIHIPGAIQPHGMMLIMNAEGLTLTQVSANVEQFLGVDPSAVGGRPLADILGSAVATDVAAVASNQVRSHLVLDLETRTGKAPFDALVYLSGERVIMELEPRFESANLTASDLQEVMRATMGHVEQSELVVELAGRIATQMREITSFDRVWVYRFHADWHGEIIGEARDPEIETWLGMHYPASDIPAQARALFLRNWLRTIPDMDFTPSPLVPRDDPASGMPIDLGGSVLRSVSPIHIRYLQNMGVRASLVISLIHRGSLWGLISGHHYSGPKYVGYATRTLCEFLAQSLSLQLGMVERSQDRDYEIRIRDTERALIQNLTASNNPASALTGGATTVADLVACAGAAVIYDGDVYTVGVAPSDDQIRDLAEWMRSRSGEVFSSSALSDEFGAAAVYGGEASGVLAVPFGHARADYLMWFRGEQRQVVPWAGDPRKPVTVDEDGNYRLHPRGSFELWEQEVRGTSPEWQQIEVQAAVDLRRAILGVLLRRAEEVAQVNDELTQMNAHLEEAAIELETQTEELLRQQVEREGLLTRERDARSDAENANRAKSEFLAMMSHELRTPLNAIAGYAELIEMGLRGPVTAEQLKDLNRIQESQRHLLGLINSILNFAKLEAGQVQFNIGRIKLSKVLSSVETLTAPQMASRRLRYAIGACDDELFVLADEEKLRQILLNLLSNSVKFTEPTGSVSVECSEEDGTVSIKVAD